MFTSLLNSENTDKTVAFVGVICSTMLIIYSTFVLNNKLYTITSLLTLLSCIAWLRLRKNSSFENLNLNLSSSHYIGLNIIFYILLTLSVLAVFSRSQLYERPIIYFYITISMVCIIALEILLCKSNSLGLLLQIIIIGLSLSWSQQILFSTVVGDDTWFHQMFTQLLLLDGKIPNNMSYTSFPMFHLLIGSTSLITALNYKYSAMLSVNISQIVCDVLCIYLIGTYLIDNKKIGLLASLLTVIADQHIFMSYWTIPNSLATIYIMYIFYLKIKQQHSLLFILISFVFLICLTLTHTIATMFAVIALSTFYLSFSFFNKMESRLRVPVSLVYCLISIVIMFTWWIYASKSIVILSKLIKWGFSLDFFIHTPQNIIIEYLSRIPQSELIFNTIGMFIFFSLSLIGCFYMISKKYGNHYSFAFSITGLAPLFLAFFSQLSKLSIIEHRWWYFAQLFLSIPLSISLVLIYENLKKIMAKYNTHLISASTIIIFFSIFSFLLIMCPMSNLDNHIYSPNTSQRAAITESEMCSIYTIAEHVNQKIGVDQYFTVIKHLPINISISPINNEIYTKHFDNSPVNFILVRDYITHNPFKLYSSTYKLDYDIVKKIESQSFSKVYDSKSVTLYSKIGV